MTDAELAQALKAAFRARNWCGATHNGEQVCCDDPRLPDVLRQPCDCAGDAIAAISVIRASGRLAPELAGDVAAQAKDAAFNALISAGVYANEDILAEAANVCVETAAPIIAAAAEAKALALADALRNLVALYETDEGTRALPEYVAAKAALAGSAS